MKAFASLWTATRAILRDRRWLTADFLLACLASWSASGIYFTHEPVLQHYGVTLPLSSDNVAPYLLFDDLFHRHLPLAGWMFPEAPFFVPDIALGWFAHVLAGGLIATVTLYALLSFVAFAWLMRLLVQRAGYDASVWRIWLLLWLVACAIGVHAPPDWLSHLYGYIFIPYIHSGTLLAVVAGLILLLDLDKVGEKRRLAAIALLSAAMLVSDRLSVLQFMLPALAVCAWMRMARRSLVHGHAAYAIGAILAVSEAIRWLVGSPFATEGNDRTPVGVSLAAFANDMISLAVGDPIGTLFIVAGLVATGFALRGIRSAGASSDTLRARIFAIFVILSVLFSIAVTLVLGRYHSMEELRYFQSAQLLGVPLAAALAFGVSRVVHQHARMLSWAMAVSASLVLPLFVGYQRTALDEYLGDQETCLRDAIAREHLTFGAAAYWHANEMTARFPEGPVVMPLSGDVAPRMRNIVDLGWFDPLAPGASPPALTFVDERGYSADALDQAFGPSSRRVACPRSSYRLYRPEDGALAHLYRHADWLPSQLLQQVRVAAVPAAAWATDAALIEGDAVHAAGTFEQLSPVLATAFDIPRGAVSVELAYAYRAQAPGARVDWQVALLDEQGAPLQELGAGALDPSAMRHFELALGERTKPGDVLGFSIAVEGAVDLRVASVRVALH